MRVGALFLEPGLVLVRMGVRNTVVAVLVVVHLAITLLENSAPSIEACYIDEAILSRPHFWSDLRRG